MFHICQGGESHKQNSTLYSDITLAIFTKCFKIVFRCKFLYAYLLD